jgi:HD superfamily phosphodiesterase
VLVAALFHDIGREKHYTGKPADARIPGHEKMSAVVIRELPADLIDKTTKNRAARIIESDGKNSKIAFEKEIVEESDTLDEAGVLTVLRMFTFGVYNRRTIEGSLRYWASERKYMNEWLNRFKIPEIRSIAEKRRKMTDSIMTELEREHKGKDIRPAKA